MIRISVRNLVEFILRSGDIDNRTAQMASKDAMQLGAAVHRKLQRREKSGYQAEVPLSTEYDCGAFRICVEGRADGIFTDGSDTVIDEIKGVMRSLEYLEEPVPVHLAQAKCYAWMYLAGQKNFDGKADRKAGSIRIRMSYVNLETEEMKYFHFRYTAQELEKWFRDLMESYRRWAEFSVRWHEERNASIVSMQFPFPWREGQKKLAGDVYRSIVRGKILFIQAPTGTGKTLSTLFPAVKALGEGRAERIFYLTARTITRMAAREAFDQLRETGLRCKSIILTAKEKICPLEETLCNPDDCPYARGHFDRINDAVYQLLTERDVFTREVLTEASERYQVCPFELSLDVSSWVDGIICDYNYVFHPRARLKRFFAEGAKAEALYLVDEAHNLADRGREMYSASLVKEDFLALAKLLKNAHPALAGALKRINRLMLEMKRECEKSCRIVEDMGTFPLRLMNLAGKMEEFLEHCEDRQLAEPARDLWFAILTFLETCDLMGQGYVIYDRILENGSFMRKLLCVDPSANLQVCLDKAAGTVFFSATLLPIDYYKAHLSTRTDNYAVYASSCFPPSNLQVLISSDTSSLYRRRGPEEYRRMAGYIRKAALSRKGNYLVYFPSYAMMQSIREVFEPDMPSGYELLCQSSSMTEAEREVFLETFDEDRQMGLIGFCVMGSFFGEGIDLRRDRLIGVIVVGTGLPMVSPEQEILRRCYDRMGKDGFRQAYLCPGMNKVLQAAGRVIRTEEDRGIVLLLDDRFISGDYQRMFPREWNAGVCTLETVSDALDEFWRSREM